MKHCKSLCVSILLCALSLSACSGSAANHSRPGLEKNPQEEQSEKPEITKTRQSELLKRPALVIELHDGSGQAAGNASMPGIDFSDAGRTEQSHVILSGTVKEVESYANGGQIVSDVTLSVDKVFKNDMANEVGDEFAFHTYQGIVPKRNQMDSYPEEIRQTFEEETARTDPEEMAAYIESGDILYEIGMSGLFFLRYYEDTGLFYETLPPGSVLLKLEEDVYISPSDYKLLHEPVLPVTYTSCERPDGFSEEDCYFTTEQVESFTGLHLTD